MHRIDIPAISFDLIAIDCTLSFDIANEWACDWLREEGKKTKIEQKGWWSKVQILWVYCLIDDFWLPHSHTHTHTHPAYVCARCRMNYVPSTISFYFNTKWFWMSLVRPHQAGRPIPFDLSNVDLNRRASLPLAMEANKHHALQTLAYCALYNNSTHCTNINTARDCKISNSMELNDDLLMNIGNIIFPFSPRCAVLRRLCY